MPRFNTNPTLRSVLDDAAYESSLNYVSDKGQRYAKRVIAKETKLQHECTQRLLSHIRAEDHHPGVGLDAVTTLSDNTSAPLVIAVHDHIHVLTAPTPSGGAVVAHTPYSVLERFVLALPRTWQVVVVRDVIEKLAARGEAQDYPPPQSLNLSDIPQEAGSRDGRTALSQSQVSTAGDTGGYHVFQVPGPSSPHHLLDTFLTKKQQAPLAKVVGSSASVKEITTLLKSILRRQLTESAAMAALVLFHHIVIELGLAEDRGIELERIKKEKARRGKRLKDMNDEQVFIAGFNKKPMNLRDVLRMGTNTEATARATSPTLSDGGSPHRGEGPRSSQFDQNTWLSTFLQRKQHLLKIICRDVLVPLLVNEPIRYPSTIERPSNGDPSRAKEKSTVVRLDPSRWFMYLSLKPSYGDGTANATTVMSLVSAAYKGLDISSNNLLLLGREAPDLVASGTGTLVPVPWWYVPPWTLRERQEESLREWKAREMHPRMSIASTSSSISDGRLGGGASLLPNSANYFEYLYRNSRVTEDAVAYDPENLLSALCLCQRWLGLPKDESAEEEGGVLKAPTISDSTAHSGDPGIPLRTLLEFPFHVAADLSPPAKAVLENILIPFVDNFWLSVVSTTSNSVSKALDYQREGSIATSTDFGDDDFIGRSPSSASLGLQEVPFPGSSAGGGGDGLGRVSFQSSGRPVSPGDRSLNSRPTSGGKKESRKSALMSLAHQKMLKQARVDSIAARVATQQEREAADRDACRRRVEAIEEEKNAKLHHLHLRDAKMKEHALVASVEKATRIAQFNVPIAAARDRLQAALDEARAAHTVALKGAPSPVPVGSRIPAEEERSRSDDFAFVPNRAYRKLDDASTAAHFLTGPAAAPLPTKGVAQEGSTVDRTVSIGSDKGSHAHHYQQQHAFVANPYLEDALVHLDASIATEHKRVAEEAAARTREAHRQATDSYHRQVMDGVISRRMEHKLSQRRVTKGKEMDTSSALEQLSMSQWPLVPAPVVPLEGPSNRDAVNALYNRLGVLRPDATKVDASANNSPGGVVPAEHPRKYSSTPAAAPSKKSVSETSKQRALAFRCATTTLNTRRMLAAESDMPSVMFLKTTDQTPPEKK